MNLDQRQELRDPWTQEDDATLLSPPLGHHWEQIVLFPTCKDNDYAIEVDLSLLDGEDDLREAGVIIRYSGEGRYYYIGLGGFGARTFIGMVQQERGESVWSCFAREGKKSEIEFGRTHRLRVECRGSRISLYEDGKNRLAVEVDAYPTGCWGFRTVRSQARFANVAQSGPSVLQAFVIMPFTTSLNFVYEILRQAVAQEGLECHRVDELMISRPIIDDIKAGLTNADLIIADLTSRNPNVYYETGFAHALGKKLILMAQSEADLAFDVRFIRTLFYRNPEDLRGQLKQAIKETLGSEG
jgi:hypothetical protein